MQWNPISLVSSGSALALVITGQHEKVESTGNDFPLELHILGRRAIPIPVPARYKVALAIAYTANPPSRLEYQRIRREFAQTSQPTNMGWLFDLYSDPVEQASSGMLMKLFGEMNEILGRRDFDLIERIFRSLDLHRLSPEAMVAMARVTFPVRQRLSEWNGLVKRVKDELAARELDPSSILQGLLR